VAIYSEADLVVPALEEIGRHQGGITTADLLVALRRTLRPTGEDLILLDGRTDDRFSQKVRNLKSHNTLRRKGLATFAGGKFVITPDGLRLVNAGRGVMQSLSNQGFSATQRKSAQERSFDTITIEEGQAGNINTRVLRRSAILRKAAIEHFADANGSIACKACDFRAEEVYGPESKGLIEIHHRRPLFLNEGMGRRASLQSAVEGVIPLCPSCHRIVHSKPGTVMSLGELKRRVAQARSSKSC
jgi:predicted HNH restriction endonuclease